MDLANDDATKIDEVIKMNNRQALTCLAYKVSKSNTLKEINKIK